MHRVKKKLLFLFCLIVLLAIASGVLRGQLPSAEPPAVKTGEETKPPAVALSKANGDTIPPQAFAAEFEAFVPPQEGLQPEVSAGPTELTEVPQTAPVQPTAQNESTKPSTEPPKTSEKPLPAPQSGDKRIVDGQAEIWIPGFGWIPNNGGGSVGTITTSDGDINKMVGYMGGDDPPRRERKSLPEPYIPQIGDVRVDLQTGIQEIFTEDGWIKQSLDNE